MSKTAKRNVAFLVAFSVVAAAIIVAVDRSGWGVTAAYVFNPITGQYYYTDDPSPSEVPSVPPVAPPASTAPTVTVPVVVSPPGSTTPAASTEAADNAATGGSTDSSTGETGTATGGYDGEETGTSGGSSGGGGTSGGSASGGGLTYTAYDPANPPTLADVPTQAWVLANGTVVSNNGKLFIAVEGEDGLVFIFDAEGLPLGYVILKPGQTLDDIDIEASLIPLGTGKVNPKTGVNAAPFIGIGAFVALGAVAFFAVGFRKKKGSN